MPETSGVVLSRPLTTNDSLVASMLSTSTSEMSHTTGTRGSTPQPSDDDIMIVEPPSKKAKCSPKGAQACGPRKESLLSHVVVVKEPFKVFEKNAAHNGADSNNIPRPCPDSNGNAIVESQENKQNKISPTNKKSPCGSKTSSATLQKQQEKQRLKEQKENERQLLQLKKMQEKLEKQREREIKEQERKERKEQELKEKEEKQRIREEERKKREAVQHCKELEKQKREELKRKREEEKNQLLEQKKQKLEEEERKKEKAKNNFKSFFIKKSPSPKKITADDDAIFQPFEVKPHMSLAPCVRRRLNVPYDEMDTAMSCQANSTLYLEENRDTWRKNKQRYVTRKSLRATRDNDEQDAVTVVENGICSTETQRCRPMAAKLLQFHENTRPAYYGTWSKKSKRICGRRPFHKDEDLLEYDYDSDDEWEEEEPGESLSGAEDEGDEDNTEIEDDEDKDGFFVPHGYLSDDEGLQSDGDDERKAESEAPCSYEVDWTKKSKALRPVVICHSPIFDSERELPKLLLDLKIHVLETLPIDAYHIVKSHKKPQLTEGSSTKRKHRPVPEEGLPYLIQHVHGNRHGLNRLISSFLKNWDNPEMYTDLPNRSPISKRQIERKIFSIAERKATEQAKNGQYIVHPRVLEQYHLTNLAIPNSAQSETGVIIAT